jgi:hypothetical protein
MEDSLVEMKRLMHTGMVYLLNRAALADPIANQRGQGPRLLASGGQACSPFAVPGALLYLFASADVLSHGLA